ncbi:MAG TPA: FtsX-like permease family protein [Bacteroidales bacterium]|nr:FtsX-like permease family protein [Bacteroidales bacterium]
MTAVKLALRNLLGAGLRTWLNVIVLSFSFVVIIWHKGFLDGWDRQARTDMIAWELGGGQYREQHYDPYDPFTLTESHGLIPHELMEQTKKGELTPILISQGTIYPSGRMLSIMVKGIDPGQQVVSIPTTLLENAGEDIPAIIGSGMAESSHLNEGDYIMLRWRDKNGAFDAAEIKIAGIFNSTVPTIDGGQIWIPLKELQRMLILPDEATLLVVKNPETNWLPVEGWSFNSQKSLLVDFDRIIKSKVAGGSILWGILLLLAMLAVFDTQVLSIFRRQKEIGTYVALGMTRRQVVTLFTAEGAMHSVLAALLGAVYGIPLFAWQALKGISLPMEGSDYGISMAETIYPVYSLGLIFSTVIIIMITTTLVSYWPSRKISTMKPTDALRGKIQ